MLNRLTGIRAVAAIFVVFFHFGDSFAALFPAFGVLRPIYKSGDMGVDLFFMLSGFILSLNYLDGFRTISRGSYRKFLRARLARIYPVHLFTLLLLTAFVLSARGAGAKLNSTHYTGFTWVTNVFLVHIWPGFNRGLSWNFPSWSISSEWFAYLLFPLFAFWIGSTKRPYIWIVLALSVYVVPCFYGIEHNPTRWALLRVTAEFVGGCFLFQIYRRGWKCPLPPWASGALALLICAVCTYFDVTRACSLPFFALLIWGLAVNTEGWLAGPVAVYWGQVSYSLYMTHGLCQIFLNRALPAGHFATSSIAIRAGLVALYLFLIVVAAVLTYHYVETPARHWLNRSEKGTVGVKEISVPPPLKEEQSAEA
jgi:peptidoglycan/LPS O-acetylase OafA/YrhL